MSVTLSPRSAGASGVWGQLSISTKQIVWAWTFLALPVLFFAVVRFYQTLEGFYLSTTDWDLLNEARFVGLDNYRKLFADPVFWQVFRNTFAYLVFGTPIASLPWLTPPSVLVIFGST